MRLALACIGSCLLVACGLALEGVASAPPAKDAGPPDVVTPPADAGSDAALEAAAPLACAKTACAAGSTSCWVEDCATAMSGWTDAVYPENGPKLGRDGGACSVKANASEVLGRVATVTAPPRVFSFDLHFELREVRTRPAAGSYMLMASVGTGDEGARRHSWVALLEGEIALCKDPDDACVRMPFEVRPARFHFFGNANLDTNECNVSVEMVSDDGASCVPLLSTKLTGPFPAAPWTAFVGCYGGTCDYSWDNAVFELR